MAMFREDDMDHFNESEKREDPSEKKTSFDQFVAESTL